MYNGYTATPKNTERVEYDLQRNEEFIAKSLAYSLAYRPTEKDADYLHELIVTCDTDPAHVLNAEQEVNWHVDEETIFGSAEWFAAVDEIPF